MSRLWSSRAAICAGAKLGTRAAAISSASGMPSSRPQSSSISPRSAGANDGSASPARERNSSTDSARARPGTCHVPFAATAQPLAARRQDRHVRAPSEDRLGERGARVEHVLARVEHEQHAQASELLGHRLRRRASCRDEDPTRGCGRIADERRISNRAELDEDDGVRRARSSRAGQPCLAATARPRQRQKPCLRQLLRDRGQLPLAADEARQLRRQSAWRQRVRLRMGGQQLPVERTRLGRRVCLERASEC